MKALTGVVQIAALGLLLMPVGLQAQSGTGQYIAEHRGVNQYQGPDKHHSCQICLKIFCLSGSQNSVSGCLELSPKIMTRSRIGFGEDVSHPEKGRIAIR